jgi:hypothetical protein
MCPKVDSGRGCSSQNKTLCKSKVIAFSKRERILIDELVRVYLNPLHSYKCCRF